MSGCYPSHLIPGIDGLIPHDETARVDDCAHQQTHLVGWQTDMTDMMHGYREAQNSELQSKILEAQVVTGLKNYALPNACPPNHSLVFIRIDPISFI